LFVPNSLRETEQVILLELKKANLMVVFSITDYDPHNNTIEYVLVGVGDSKDVPERATTIVQRHLESWKATYMPRSKPK
jgi:hypothetical protein